MAADQTTWFPLFEFTDWTYQSVVVRPTPAEQAAAPGSAIAATKWAAGTLLCGQAFNEAGGYSLAGTLSFRPGVELQFTAKGALGSGNAPATFEAMGTGTEGPTRGAIYQLVGWVFPEDPIRNGAGRVLSVRGSVRAVRGPDTKPDADLGGMPLETVGTFVIARVE